MQTQKSDFKYIGKPHRLVDGRDKVSGYAKFAADLHFPNLAYAHVILSPYAHATIGTVDRADALALDGVIAVLTADDLPTSHKIITSRFSADLARGKVLWAGQPVAVVVAESPAIALDAAELVMIDYEPLPAVVDMFEALKPESPTLWPNGLPTDDMNEAHGASNEGSSTSEATYNNLGSEAKFERGDIAQGFAEADCVYEQTYTTSFVHHAYMEPHTCVIDPHPSGDAITVFTATQGKFIVRDGLAKHLDLAPRNVRVVPTQFGGGFGAKYGLIEPLTAAVALAIGRTTRLTLSRTDDTVSTTPTPAIRVELKTGAKKDGTVTALSARIFTDNCAFGFGHGGLVTSMLGFYKWPNLHVETFEIHTNKAPIGAYRAPGAPQAAFAIESNMAEMATQLELDPIAFRRQNAVESGDLSGTGSPWSNIGAIEVLDQLQAHPLWQAADCGENEAVGIALSGWPTFMGTAESVCRVGTDGTVSIEAGHVDVSQNNSTFALIAAEAFDVDPESVEIIQRDTTGVFGPHSGGSIVTYTMAGAIRSAVESAKTKLLELAGDEFEAAAEDIVIVDGKAMVKGVPDKTLAIGELAQIARTRPNGPGPISGDGTAAPEKASPAMTASLVKIHVDPATGKITPLHYVCIQDVGFALNPTLVEGQMHGGMLQGLMMGLQERMVFDEYGQSVTGSWMDYAFPHSDQSPVLEAIQLTNPSPFGPYGMRGVGEPPISGGAAALANAVRNATGKRPTMIPILPETLI